MKAIEHAAVIAAVDQIESECTVYCERYNDRLGLDKDHARAIIAAAVEKVCGELETEIERLRTSLAEAIGWLRGQDEIVGELRGVLWTTGLSRKAALNPKEPTP